MRPIDKERRAHERRVNSRDMTVAESAGAGGHFRPPSAEARAWAVRAVEPYLSLSPRRTRRRDNHMADLWAAYYDEDPDGTKRSLAAKTEFERASQQWLKAEWELIQAARIFFGSEWRYFLADARRALVIDEEAEDFETARERGHQAFLHGPRRTVDRFQ